MDISRVFSTFSGLAKDPTAWFGAGSSYIANVLIDRNFYPQTLEGFLAATLSIVSTMYILIRIVLLWRKNRKTSDEL